MAIKPSPCFLALTRGAVFLGLPINYLMIILVLVIGGFIATNSFVYMGLSAIVTTFALKAIIAYDSAALEVFLTDLSKFPQQSGFFGKKGAEYHA